MTACRRGAVGGRAIVVALLALGVVVPRAAACSFVPGPGYDPVKHARLAFTGEVTKVRVVGPRALPGSGDAERYVATIRVHRVYKGETGPALRVRGSTDAGLCGFGPLEVGERLGLALTARRSPYAIGITSRVLRATLETATGGRSHRPGRT